MEEKEVLSALSDKGYQAAIGQTVMGTLQPKGALLSPMARATKVKVHYLTFNDEQEMIVLPLSFWGKLVPEEIYAIPCQMLQVSQLKIEAFIIKWSSNITITPIEKKMFTKSTNGLQNTRGKKRMLLQLLKDCKNNWLSSGFYITRTHIIWSSLFLYSVFYMRKHF